MTQPIADQQATRSIGQRFYAGLLLLLLCPFLVGCDEPFIVMSGAALAGEVSDPPVDWTASNEVEIIQLEVQPDDPYSINIWMAGIGPDIYVATGDDDTAWSAMLAVDPDVRIRIEGTIYELRASKIGEGAEKRAVASEYVAKYGLDEDDNWVLDGQVFRLDRR